MNIISLLFIIFYFVYVISGDHIIAKIVFDEPYKFSPVPSQILKRSVFITYLSLLAVAYTLNNFNTTNWIIAFVLSIISLIAFSIKWSYKGFVIPPNGNYYGTGTIEHVMIILPLLFSINNLNFNDINYINLILFTFALILYYVVHPVLYVY